MLAAPARGQVRKDQATLTGQEKRDFVNAILQLKVTYRPGSTLSVYDEFVQAHHDAFARDAAHGGPAFLPWHREFLREFELALQTVNPSVTIPYWRFDVDNSPTSSLWAPDFLGGNGDPTDNHVVKDGPFRQGQWQLLYDGPDLRRDFGGGQIKTLPKTSDLDALFGISQYDVFPYDEGSPLDESFRNAIEGFNYPTGAPELHNRVHAWVGGSMAIQDSPEDPVFWMVHAEIDRLWARWEDRYGDVYEPVEGCALGQNLHDPMFPFGTVTPADVLDHRALGYRYDTEPAYDLRYRSAGNGLNGLAVLQFLPAANALANALVAAHAGHAGWADDPGPFNGLPGDDAVADGHVGHAPTGPATGGFGESTRMEVLASGASGVAHAGSGRMEHLAGACT
jgi:tyrosinase